MKTDSRKKEFFGIWLLLLGFFAAAVTVLVLCYTFSARLPDNVGRELTDSEVQEVIERNSGLIDYIYLSPNADFPRNDEETDHSSHGRGSESGRSGRGLLS